MRAIAIALAFTLVSAQAHAEVPLASTLSAEARTSYDKGREAFADAKFEAAESAFRAAYQLSNDARLLWNVAACQSKRGRFASMLQTITRYQKERGAALTPKEAEEIDRARKAASAKVASLRIETDPSGVEVHVGDVTVTTPLEEPLVLDPGPYEVVFTKSGYENYRMRANVAAGPASWSAHLNPVRATAPPAVIGPIGPEQVPASSGIGRTVGVITLGTGIALTIGSAIMLGAAHGKYGSLQASCAPNCASSDISSGRTLETGGYILLSSGTVVAIGGALLFAFSPKRSPREAP